MRLTVARPIQEPPYAGLLGDQGSRLLLLMAGLPLMDGVFASAVLSGALSRPVAALAFGLSVFSGSGCLIAVTSLRGSLTERLRRVLLVYALIFAAGLATIPAAPVLQVFVLPSFPLFSALVLLGLALELGGCSLLPDSGPPSPLHSVGGAWIWGIRALAVPQTVLAAGLMVSLLHLLTSPPSAATLLHLGPRALSVSAAMPLLAILSGFVLTLVGTVCSSLLERRLKSLWVQRGGAAGLALIAALVLGLPLPPVVPLFPVALGLVTAIAAGRSPSS